MSHRLDICEEYDNLIKPVMIASKMICIWPLKKDHSASRALLRVCHLCWLFFVLILTCVTVMADIVYNFDDLDELTECALLCSIFYLAVIRLVIYSLHYKDMMYVVEIMRKDWISSSYEDRIILKKKCHFAFQVTKYFIILTTLAVIAFSCTPILEVYLLGTERRVLPFRGHFFINQTISPTYEYLYIFNVMAGGIVGGTIVSATSFNFIAITHGTAKFAMLRKKLEAMSSHDPNVNRIMGDYIKQHQDAIVFADTLEKIINILALGQFVISTGLICFAGFQITSMLQDKGRLMKYSSFLNAAILELFMFSFSGNGLIDESDAVGESAYNSNWIGGTFGRDLQIMMIRSKIPSRITAAKFYNMSLQSFSQVLSTSFSYMMVLKATKDE